MARRNALPAMMALIVIGATACSGTKLIYERLDWLTTWRMHDYVSLKPEQNQEFKQHFAALWHWHRREELPRYAQDFREMANLVDRTVTATQVADYSARFQTNWARLMRRTIADLCNVVHTLDDDQVRDILEEVDEDVDEFAEKYVDAPEQKLRRNSERNTEKRIADWIGSLNPGQKQMLKQWSGERRNIAADWLAYRKDWRTRLAIALEQRRAFVTCEQFVPLLVMPMELRNKRLAADQTYNDRLWEKLIADVFNAMDSRQREHLRSRLRKFANDLDELSRRSPTVQATGPISTDKPESSSVTGI